MQADSLNLITGELADGAIAGDEIATYNQTLETLKCKWKTIPFKELYQVETAATAYYDFYYLPKAKQLQSVFMRNPYMEILESSFDWPAAVKEAISRDCVVDQEKIEGIALLPQLFFDEVRQAIIDELDYNILTVLEQPCSLSDLSFQLMDCFPHQNHQEQSQLVTDLILAKLKILLYNKCVLLTPTL